METYLVNNVQILINSYLNNITNKQKFFLLKMQAIEQGSSIKITKIKNNMIHFIFK